MSPSAALPMADQRRFGAREIAWWAGAAALVLVAHAAVGYAMQSWRPAEPDGGPPQAQVIELSPMALAPAEPAPVSNEIAPDQPDPAEEPVNRNGASARTARRAGRAGHRAVGSRRSGRHSRADPADPGGTGQPAAAQGSRARNCRGRHAGSGHSAAAAETGRQTRRGRTKKQTKTEVKEPAEVKVKKPVREAKQRPEKEKAAPPRTTASVAATSAARAAAPKSAKAAAARRGVSPDRWNSRLRAWIRSAHNTIQGRRRPGAPEGSASVTFTIDGSGRVLSARLARSSGDPDLDRAALSALQGASVPEPPPELGSRITKTAPFTFDLRN